MAEHAGVVVLAFGTPGTIHANNCIGDIATRLAAAASLPVFRQCHIKVGEGLVITDADEEGTIDCLVSHHERVRAAAAPHMTRCLRDFKYAARRRGVDVKIQACSGVSDYSDADWFDPASTQSRTRSRRVWDVWEFIVLRIMPMWFYERISIRPR
jgi:hypothetical protein